MGLLRFDPLAAHECATGRTEILDNQASALDPQVRMPPRDRDMIDSDTHTLGTPHYRVALFERVLANLPIGGSDPQGAVDHVLAFSCDNGAARAKGYAPYAA
jgi:hypothetical protein